MTKKKCMVNPMCAWWAQWVKSGVWLAMLDPARSCSIMLDPARSCSIHMW